MILYWDFYSYLRLRHPYQSDSRVGGGEGGGGGGGGGGGEK